MNLPVTPILAATLMLVRDRAGLEVLMVERHGELLFGPGALVFPGGKLDPQDRDPHLGAYVVGGDELSPEPRELRLCAVRETFEETGILLGRPANGGAMVDEQTTRALRLKVAAGELSFREAVALSRVELDLDGLTLFARWITPPGQPIRFDATFYLARAPDGQSAVCDGRETITAEWLAPKAALDLADRGLRKLMRPTRVNLVALAESASVADAMATARGRKIQTVLQPD